MHSEKTCSCTNNWATHKIQAKAMKARNALQKLTDIENIHGAISAFLIIISNTNVHVANIYNKYKTLFWIILIIYIKYLIMISWWCDFSIMLHW